MIAQPLRVQDAAGIRARGVSPAWALCSLAFLLASLLVGLGVGAVGIGPGAIVVSSPLRIKPRRRINRSFEAPNRLVRNRSMTAVRETKKSPSFSRNSILFACEK